MSPKQPNAPEAERTAWARALELFDHASDLAPEAIESWRAGLADEAAVLSLLDPLLAAHQRVQTSDLFSTLPSGGFGLPTNDDAEQGLHEGAVVGGFRLIERLGSGGMATVWRARYEDGRMDREVAIKLPRLGAAALAWRTQRLRERMARERGILTLLSHPHIARLLDAGVTAAGQPFLVLEWVRGTDLERFANQGRLSISDRLRLMLRVLEAVEHAHHSLVLHRDIKPSNILVDDAGTVKLLDFGVAKMLPGADAEPDSPAVLHDTITRLEQPALTLAFAAPEQIRREPLTTAADVYACGVVLYHLLSGQSPHQPARESRGALEDCILHTEPALASRRVLGDTQAQERGLPTAQALSRRLRGDLDTILHKALKIAPQDRYASARTMAEDIERHLSQRPISARADSRWYVARRYIARNRWAVIGTSLAVMALLALTQFSVQQWLRADRMSERALEAKARSEASQKFFASSLGVANPEENRAITDYDRAVVDKAFDTARAQFGTHPETLALILSQLGEVYRRQGRADKWLEVQRQRMLTVNAAPKVEPATLVSALTDMGQASLHSPVESERAGARGLLQRASDMAMDSSLGLAVDVRIRAIGAWGEQALSVRALDVAGQAADAALALAAEAPQLAPDVRAFTHQLAAMVARTQGKFDRAGEHFAQADQANPTAVGQGVVDRINGLTLWAGNEVDAANYELAITLARRALKLAEESMGHSGDLTLAATSHLVFSLERMGRAQDAYATARALLTPHLHGPEALQRGRAAYMMGYAAQASGDFSQAKFAFEAAREGLHQHPTWAALLNGRVATWWLEQPREAQSLVRAQEHASASVDGLTRARRTDSLLYAAAQQRMVVVHARFGQIDQAKTALQAGCRWPLEVLGPGHPERLRCAAYAALLESNPQPRSTALRALAAELSAGPHRASRLAAEVRAAQAWLDGTAPTGLPDPSRFPFLN